jgi:hypothetical protein
MGHVVPIDEWPLGKDHKIVVSLIEYEGRWRFDARIVNDRLKLHENQRFEIAMTV